MKKIYFSIIKKETKINFKILFFFNLSILFFLTVLFGFLSFNSNFSKNFYSKIDSKEDFINITIKNIKLEDITKKASKNTIMTFHKKNYTYNVTLKSKEGKEFKTDEIEINDNHINIKSYRGVMIKNIGEALFPHNEKESFKGNWVSNENEIVISSFLSDSLNVKINDEILINENEFKVVGIFFKENIKNDDFEIYSKEFIFKAPDNIYYDEANLFIENAETVVKPYNYFKEKKYDVRMPDGYKKYFDNINTQSALIGAVSILMFIVILIIIYSGISMIIMIRKNFINKLIIFGMKRKTIANIYISLISIFFLISLLCSLFLLKYFNIYLTNFSKELFGFEFKYETNIFLLIIYSLFLFSYMYILIFFKLRNFKFYEITSQIKEIT